MPTFVTLDALEPDAVETGILLDRTRAYLRWGAPLELRAGRCEIMFVGYDGATEEPRRRVRRRSTLRRRRLASSGLRTSTSRPGNANVVAA
jgi:hypothetical protein